MRFLLLSVALLPIALLAQSVNPFSSIYNNSLEWDAPAQAAAAMLLLVDAEGAKVEKGKRYQSIGLGVDVLNGKDTYELVVFDVDKNLDKIRQNREYVVQLPQLSLIYERQLLRSFSNLFGELQARVFRRKESGTYDFYQIGEGNVIKINYNEFVDELDLMNLYFYPGLNYHFGKSREILTYVGAGAAIAYPVHFERSLAFRSANFPEFPATQSVMDVQDVSYGYYVQAGFQMHFPGGLSFSAVLRQEELEQVWNEVPQDDLLDSELYIPRDELSLQNQFMFQCQLLYSW
jgi:hypothetical protein